MCRSSVYSLALLAVLFGVVPAGLALAGGSYPGQVACLVLIFGLLAAAMHLVAGVAGLLHLGHAAFYGVGAYVAALLAMHMHWPFMLVLPLSGLGAAFLALLVALPTLRLTHIYFAVATLAIGQVINLVLVNWVDVTGGPNGLSMFAPVSLFGHGISGPVGLYYVVAAVVAPSVWAIHRLSHSYYGNALRALREDDQCAAAMGIDTTRAKTEAFTVAGFFAGIAGALWAYTTGYVSPGDFRFSETVLVLAMVVVGGLGSLPGALIGALMLVLLPEALRQAGDVRNLLVGVVMFVSILFLPKGLLGEVPALALMRGWQGAGTRKVGWR